MDSKKLVEELLNNDPPENKDEEFNKKLAHIFSNPEETKPKAEETDDCPLDEHFLKTAKMGLFFYCLSKG